MKKPTSTCLLTLALALTIAGPTLHSTAAENKSTVDPTGTWKVTISSTNTQSRPSENILKLKMNGGTLTGTLSRVSTANGAAMTWDIKETKLQAGDISFKVVNGDVASTYKGKLRGETIQGTVKIESSAKTTAREWKAERLKQ